MLVDAFIYKPVLVPPLTEVQWYIQCFELNDVLKMHVNIQDCHMWN